MNIDKLSSKSSLSKQTIFKYIKMGLLPPPLKVSQKKHLYDESHLGTLKMIHRFREEGLSLQETKEAISSGRPPANFREKRTSSAKGIRAMSTENTNDKKYLLVDNAIRLFSIHGYENVKISDITDASSIGKGTFYLYFKNKRDLLYECVEQIRSLLALAESSDDILEEKDIVVRMRNRWVNFHTQYPHFGGVLQLLHTMAHSEDPEIREKSIHSYNAVISPIMEDINKAQGEGIVRDFEPEILAYAIIGIMENMTFRLNQDDKYPIEKYAEAVEDFARRVFQKNNG